MKTEMDIAAFARRLRASDERAVQFSDANPDAEFDWVGEHTTALADWLGREPTREEIATARASYEAT